MSERHFARDHADPALDLALLWDAGSTPELEPFLAAYPNLSSAELAAVLRVDQSRRWRQGQHHATENYFGRFPAVHDDPTCALDMIHHEFILRESLGPAPSVDEFTVRFPEHADTIRDQVAIHRALATGIDRGESTSAVMPAGGRAEVALAGSSLQAHTRFGRYLLLECIGHGGMGTVYRAYDDQLDRQVALKVLRAGGDPGGQFANRFLREARIAANFTDPRLCPVHDAGILDGVHYFTMPLLSGETLALRLARDGPVPAAVAVRLVAMIARGVSIAHRAGVVHRDLKPANIMMNAQDEPVILDFGLARHQTMIDSLSTEKGVVLGTPGFMAPEQIGGDSQSVGPAADIYSLGVILYQLLTGRLPFDGPPHEVMRKALTEDPVPPTEIRPELNRAIEAVCLKAMARDMSARFPSMEAFADALESLPDEPSPTLRSPRTRSGHRIRTTALSLGVLIGLALCWFYVARERVPRLPRASDTHFPVGATWSGRFVFRGKLSGYEGDVVLTVSESRGNTFRANYATEGGKFAWEVVGTESDDHVHWEFVRATHGNVTPSIVGQAHVSGHFRNGVLDLIFTDGDSSADVVLTPAR